MFYISFLLYLAQSSTHAGKRELMHPKLLFSRFAALASSLCRKRAPLRLWHCHGIFSLISKNDVELNRFIDKPQYMYMYI